MSSTREPMEWFNTTLGQVIDIFDHKRVPLSSIQRGKRQGPYPYYGASGVVDHIDGYILEGRYLLVSEDGENLNSRKTPIAFFTGGKFWVNNHAHIIRAKPGLADDYFLMSFLANANLSGYITGAAQPKLSQGNLKEIKLSLPPLAIQRKIAAILSAYDDLIENNTRRIQILEEMAQALYREWFVNFRFPGHETSGMVESEVGPIPEGWRVTPFSKAANFVNGFAFAPHHWKEDGLPIIKIAELKNGVTDKTPRNPGDDVPAKFHIINGDVLFSWSADLDAYIWGHGVGLLNQHLFKVEPTDGITKEFLYFSLKDRMGEFRNRSNGATMKHIKRSALDEVCFAAPAPELVRRFSDNVNPIVEQTLNLASRNNCLRQTRDLLLPKLISGEVDVADLDIAMGETN